MEKEQNHGLEHPYWQFLPGWRNSMCMRQMFHLTDWDAFNGTIHNRD